MKFEFVERELTWEELNEFLSDADRELAEADWMILLQRLAGQNAALALRLYLRRFLATLAPGETQMECAVPLFALPGAGLENRMLCAATSNEPKWIVLPLVADGRLSCLRLDAASCFETSKSSPQTKVFEPPPLDGLCGLEGLPLIELKIIDDLNAERAPLPSFYSLGISRILVGRLTRALKIAEVYMSERSQGGRKLTEWSEPARRLSDLKWTLSSWEQALARTAAARSLALQLRLAEASLEFVSSCVDLMGGAGYMKEYKLEEIYRDVLSLAGVWGSGAEKRLWLMKQENVWPKS